MPFAKILVAIDGSECSNRAFAKALELAALAHAHITALAVEGPLPAYAATVGEVEEVKREKDTFFRGLAAQARLEGENAGIQIDVDVRPGHAAELITRVAEEGATTWSCSATAGTSSATACLARPPTGLPSTRIAR